MNKDPRIYRIYAFLKGENVSTTTAKMKAMDGGKSLLFSLLAFVRSTYVRAADHLSSSKGNICTQNEILYYTRMTFFALLARLLLAPFVRNCIHRETDPLNIEEKKRKEIGPANNFTTFLSKNS